MRYLFVGGPGRSGTSFVADRLGNHAQVVALKDIELKIFCEKNGLQDLFHALVETYSPNRAVTALDQFRRMVEALIDNVTRSERKQIICISSKMGSMADNDDSGGAYLYRSSKAALNAVVRSLTVDLADRGVTVVAFHPGWVSTDMGGHEAPVTPAESVHGMREVIERLTPADSGRFLDYQGNEVPW